MVVNSNDLVAYVQQNIGMVYGYLIPLIVMILAQIIFSLGNNRYVSTLVEGKPLRNTPVSFMHAIEKSLSNLMVNNSTNINKMNTYLSPQAIENTKYYDIRRWEARSWLH
jgi:hypothetical protein